MSRGARVVLGTMEMGRRLNLEESTRLVTKFQQFGHSELDSAYMYAGGHDGGPTGGLTEEYLGKITNAIPGFISTKANPAGQKTLSPASLRHQLETSMKKMNTNQLDLFYLHWPCMDVPLEDTLRGVDELYQEGKFKRFGLSNYISWQVSEVHQICSHYGYVKPTVYQGMYNCLTRTVENELLSCLHKYDMDFYCYNPLAGGMLTGKHKRGDHPENSEQPGRFAGQSWGKAYRERFWRDQYFDAIEMIEEACRGENISITSAALRWARHHSELTDKDAIIIGCSSIEHLTTNLDALEQGPLPQSVVDEVERANELTRGHSPTYFRNVSQRF